MTSTATRIKTNAAAIKAEAEKIDTSRTQTVKMSDLQAGDVLLQAGPKAMVFPFTLSDVKVIRKSVVLRATHGWFNMTPYPATDTAVIVARG